MNRTLALIVATLSLASYAGAQALNVEINGAVDPKLKLERTDDAKRQAALRAAIDDMNDGVGTGEQVVSYLQSQGIGVDFAEQSESAQVAITSPHGQRTLLLSDKLPLQPRVLAVAIAREAARLQYADMQPSAERDYMEDTTVAQTWIELGGERAKLPVLEPLTGYANAELSAPIERWSSNDESRHRSIAEQLKEAQGCLDSQNYHVIPMCQDQKAKLEADAKRSDEFHKAELEWFMTHRPQ